ncbi:hypothetical protein AGMMS49992_18170 [Clostridia bacterium]|nr:hypothetical protein AGMMS49992_18170 [Clostridia bacterium]
MKIELIDNENSSYISAEGEKMSFDFTVAIADNDITYGWIREELQYVKAALLYADAITIVSPTIDIFALVSNFDPQSSYNHVRVVFEKVISILSRIGSDEDKALIQRIRKTRIDGGHIEDVISEAEMRIICSYVSNYFDRLLDLNQHRELKWLLSNKNIHIQRFFTQQYDEELLTAEHLRYVQRAISSSYPILDSLTNMMMGKLGSDMVVDISDTKKSEYRHGALVNDFIQRLPSFETSSFDEIIDIRSELSNAVTRFRSKTLKYTRSIQEIPWSNDFSIEATLLFDSEVSPAIYEIEEMTKENSFIKNLRSKIFSDKDTLSVLGGLAVGISAAGVLQSATSAIVAGGGAVLLSKIMQTISEYVQTRDVIRKKDLYFYYRAAKKLKA